MEFRFSNCVLDTGRHRLTRDGAEVHVEPQVFDLLVLLVGAGGRLVTRDEIVETVWNGRIVSEATIAARISAARAAVGDDGARQAVIRTLPRVGLELVVPVETGDAPPAAPAPAPAVPRVGAVDVRLTTSADGSGIAWTSEGEGLPLMRAGHWLTNLELDGQSPIWAPWLSRLGRGRRLIRYDFRGTGLSDADCGSFEIDRLVEDMEAVADAAGLDRFDVFAPSQSCAVTMAFAVRHPDRLRRIVTYGGWPQGSSRRAGDGTAMTQVLSTLLEMGWGNPDGGHMRSFAALFMPGASPAQQKAFVDCQIASATAARAVEIRNAIAEFDVVDLLKDVAAPVLILHSRNDSLHPFSQAQLLARHLPDATLRVLQSTNHIILDDEPAFDSMMGGVDAFLGEG